jgi:hypothetical protein
LFRAFSFYDDECLIPECYDDRIEELWNWFNENLPVPDRLSRAVGRFRIIYGICWLKPSAIEHIRCMWDLAAVYEACGIPVQFLKTSRPRHILYEDDFQIVAEPACQLPSRTSPDSARPERFPKP